MTPDPVFDGALIERVVATRWQLPDGTWAWHIHQSTHTAAMLGDTGERLWSVIHRMSDTPPLDTVPPTL
jgi:hypothetical protein